MIATSTLRASSSRSSRGALVPTTTISASFATSHPQRSNAITITHSSASLRAVTPQRLPRSSSRLVKGGRAAICCALRLIAEATITASPWRPVLARINAGATVLMKSASPAISTLERARVPRHEVEPRLEPLLAKVATFDRGEHRRQPGTAMGYGNSDPFQRRSSWIT